MNRRILRYALVFCLLISSAFAAWAWFRPYAWCPDPAARSHIIETLVTKDQSFFWVTVHLKVNPGLSHDLEKPVRLETASSKNLEPADTTFGGSDQQGTTDIWVKFWLESKDLNRHLTLRINDGELLVKSNDGIPNVDNLDYRNFTTNQW